MDSDESGGLPLNWELIPFDFRRALPSEEVRRPLDYSAVAFVDTDWGLVEVIRVPGTHKVPALLKSKTKDVTLTGCRGHCLYPSDFRCRNLPCFNELMQRTDPVC